MEKERAGHQSPFPRAGAVAVNDLIETRETRPALGDWMELIEPLLSTLKGPRTFTYKP